MEHNIITATDSYKLTHWNQYPEGTEIVYSYFEARSGATYNKTVFFGLQYLLKKYLHGRIVTLDKIEEAEKLTKIHLGSSNFFNRKMWRHILETYEGRLPIQIKAVQEGTPVDINNVLMTVENTDPLCFPLTNHLETLLSHVWSASTTATLSYEIYLLLKHYLEITGCNLNTIKFMLHDFGFRGTSSSESAGFQGAGHLLNFMGTDTLAAIELIRDYYNASYDNLAYSVPATEHSIMTSYGPDGEYRLLKELIQKYPKGILSLVIDSYDYRRFINTHARNLKSEILSRGGKTVFRPDSGDPNSVTIDVLELLDSVFGSSTNDKGYKELNPAVGVLWGDGIDYQGIRGILYTMRNQGWAANNIVFGCGGGLLQKLNRDTQRFAFKCSAQRRNGVWYDIYKKPLDASKASKRGILKLIKTEEGYKTVPACGNTGDDQWDDRLSLVFRDGHLIRDDFFQQCRRNTGNW